MNAGSNLSLIATILDPQRTQIAHKLRDISLANVEGGTLIEEVVFNDWIPSGSFGTVALRNGDNLIYSEEKMIPNAPGWQEGAEALEWLTGKRWIKHECDVWVRLVIDHHGTGCMECHMGVPGSDQQKAVFKVSFTV